MSWRLRVIYWLVPLVVIAISLQWRHNGCDSVSNHQPHYCLLNRLFRRKSKKTSKLCVTGLCAGNSPGTGEFPAEMASYAEDVSIWRRHHVFQNPHADCAGAGSSDAVTSVIPDDHDGSPPCKKERMVSEHMMTSSNAKFFALLAICPGNSPVPGEFLAHRPGTRSSDVSFICVWINGWVNNREAGDLKRYRAHYDVTVMNLLTTHLPSTGRTDWPKICLSPWRHKQMVPMRFKFLHRYLFTMLLLWSFCAWKKTKQTRHALSMCKFVAMDLIKLYSS